MNQDEYRAPQGRMRRRLRIPAAALMWLTWAAAVGWAGQLYFASPDFASIPGMGEVQESHAAAPEVARVQAVYVTAGQRVKTGELMVRFDGGPLELEAAEANAQIAKAEAELRAGPLVLRRERLAENRSFLRLSDSSTTGLLGAKVELGLDMAEAEGLKVRIRWWEAMVQRQLTDELTLQDLRGQLTAVQARIRARQEAVEAWQQQLGRVEKRFDQWQKATPAVDDDPQQLDLAPLRAEVEVAKALLRRIEDRKRLLVVRASVDGVVSRVLMQPGDVATAGQTVVVLRAPEVQRVIAYAQDAVARRMRVGTPVHVMRRDGTGQRLEARVVGFGGVAELPLQLQSVPPRAPLAAEEVILSLVNHTLLPGEPVDVAFMHGVLSHPVDSHSQAAGPPQPAVALPPPATPADQPRPEEGPSVAPPGPAALPQAPTATQGAGQPPQVLVMPAELSAVTRFEPSGWLWLPERQRYLIVSDDTGLADSSEHAPWLFSADAQGQVDPAPWTVQKAPAFSDLEALTRSADGALWLLASQSVSRKGNRSDPRTWLIRAELRGDQLVATGQRSLATALATLRNPTQLQRLGLSQVDPAYRKGAAGFDRVLDIEGMAADGAGLLLALKRPLDHEGNAIVWRLADAKGFLKGAPLNSKDLQVWARLPLSAGPASAPLAAGLADLIALPDGRFAALATALGDGDEGRQDLGLHSALYLLQPQLGSDRPKVQLLQRFHGVHAEGLALTPDGKHLAVVFDEGALPPHWLTVSWPAL
jgi:multidrug resistance efflux pump